MFCVSSSLEFYNSVGMNYWGVNSLNQYYCDFKMPKHSITEMVQIVKDTSIEEFTKSEYDYIHRTLQLNGSEFNDKQTDIYNNSLKLLGDRYMHDDFLKNH